MKQYPRALILAACAALSITAPCRGAESENQMLQEVVVTAQKREQSVQDVPLSMTVFTGANMTGRRTNRFRTMQVRSPTSPSATVGTRAAATT